MSNSRPKKNSRLFLIVRIAVVVCGITWGIWWVSRGQRWQKLRDIFAGMNPWLFAAALAIFVISQIILAMRWWLLLRTQDIRIHFGAAVRLHFLGLFYNNFMPSSVGGDLVRAWYVTHHTPKKFAGALSVFVDRVVGLLGTLMIAMFFYWLFLRGKNALTPADTQDGSPGGFMKSARVVLAVVAVCLVVLLLLCSLRRFRKLVLKLWVLFNERVIRRFKDAVTLYCRNPLAILAAFGLTVFLQIATITGFYLVGLNIGIEASIKYYYVFFTLTWVLGAIPVSIGGVVVVEVLLASLFVKFAGVGAEAASALALCQRAVWMLASLPGAVIHLTGAHLPKDIGRDDGV